MKNVKIMACHLGVVLNGNTNKKSFNFFKDLVNLHNAYGTSHFFAEAVFLVMCDPSMNEL